MENWKKKNFNGKLQKIKPCPLEHKQIFNILGSKVGISIGDLTVMA